MRALLLVSVVLVAAGCGGESKGGPTANPLQTYCFALFDDRDAAERAAAQGRAQGLTTQVDRIEEEEDSIPTRWGVVFVSPQVGDDAREARRVYRQVRRREGGVSGHGETGCVERRRFT